MSQQKVILVAGPTASGKSAKAMALALNTRGTIINADAMQIYEGLPILSAQPSAADMHQIPHLLYGVLDPSEKSSAGQWLARAKEAIEKTHSEKRTPILVGGTGLYFKALLGGLANIPDVPPEVRHRVQKLYDKLGEDLFRAKLAKLDSESAARLAKNDRQRSIRAYEVILHTGKPLGSWHKNVTPGFLGALKIEKHLVMPPRDQLYATCDGRLAKMMEQGAVEEVKKFLQRKLDPALPAMKTLGLREIAAYLKDEVNLKEAISAAQQATRNYAKRQMTWFRNQWSHETIDARGQ